MSTVDSTSASSSAINATFTTKTDNSQMTSKDFLKIFITQLQNQDFTKPMDNSEMMNQITQFSNMQTMQEMASYSKSNYAMSLIGKSVTASRYSVSGQLDTTTGMVQKVSLVDNEYVIYIDGKKYTMDQIMEVNSSTSSDSKAVNAATYKVTQAETSSTSATVKWSVPTEDDVEAKKLTYTVYYSKTGPFKSVEEVESGKMFGSADQKNFTSETITGLEPGSSYFVNVIVKDSNGSKSAFTPTTVLTKN